MLAPVAVAVAGLALLVWCIPVARGVQSESYAYCTCVQRPGWSQYFAATGGGVCGDGQRPSVCDAEAMGPDPDIYNIKHGFERLDLVGQRLRNSVDLELLRHARRALLPLPLIDRRRQPSSDVFPPFRKRPARAMAGKRVAVVVSGGGGAAVAVIATWIRSGCVFRASC